MTINELLNQPDGKTLEFQRDLSSRRGVLRTIVAFANTAGGTLVIGVEGGTWNVRGVADPLASEERIANLVTDPVAPRVLPEIEIHPWRSTHVVAISVHPSTAKPELEEIATRFRVTLRATPSPDRSRGLRGA